MPALRSSIIAILLLGTLLILLPIPFERLHDDEVLKWYKSGLVLEGKTPLSFYGHMPLVLLLYAPVLSLTENILAARLLTGLMTIGSALLIFLIAKEVFQDEKPALAGSLLFLLSFHTLRFGGRFYSDPYGLFFFILALYLVTLNRTGAGSVSAILAIIARDTWIPIYPFLLLYVYLTGRDTRRFLLFSAVPVAIFLAVLQSTIGLKVFLPRSVISGTIQYLFASLATDAGALTIGIAQGWLEFGVVQAVTLVGLLAALRYDSRSRPLALLILPQFFTLSITGGFIVNGAMTQYVLPLQASMALVAGQGLYVIWGRFGKREGFLPALAVLLIAQTLAFNYAATSLSLSGAKGVYDLGYSYDREIISLLEGRAQGETIVGIHGAFVKEAREWQWVERNVSAAIEYNPDWYITFPYLLRFKETEGFEAYHIGPYVVIHTPPGRRLGDLIEPVEFKKWKLRS